MSPIKPENRHYYQGDTWRILREAILSRARQACECVGECGMAHKDWCNRKNKESGVVLTIAHLCHRPECTKPTHLKALCQRCHLRVDRFNRAHHRQKKIREGKG